MRRQATALTAVLLLGLTACGGTDEPTSSPDTKPPAYTTLKDSSRLAELLVADATKGSATAAIHDWIAKNAGDRKAFTVQVVRTKDAGAIVCRAEYYADEQTAKVQTGGRVTADQWPHTDLECPDPAGP
ncbi:hypothetical protein E3E14_25235 [Streptomyces sp. ICN441]|uniref:hypothetical protein n=1 Tax=Streptomyces sp. ICN441 TaxID=2558286 RepID=UPI00106CD14B|nr:hypothetical protein [Streptomyces sp. ICN441]TFE42491.1 hypothetical protein E3E14_25235 [Streptomyces sp. ICN441]